MLCARCNHGLDSHEYQISLDGSWDCGPGKCSYKASFSLADNRKYLDPRCTCVQFVCEHGIPGCCEVRCIECGTTCKNHVPEAMDHDFKGSEG